jgi:hypothetical protein
VRRPRLGWGYGYPIISWVLDLVGIVTGMIFLTVYDTCSKLRWYEIVIFFSATNT